MVLKLFEVISARNVMVEDKLNCVLHGPGKRFSADPTSRDIIRLLRLNAIREVSDKELRGN